MGRTAVMLLATGIVVAGERPFHRSIVEIVWFASVGVGFKV